MAFLKLLFYSLVARVFQVPQKRQSLRGTMFIVITQNKDCGCVNGTGRRKADGRVRLAEGERLDAEEEIKLVRWLDNHPKHQRSNRTHAEPSPETPRGFNNKL